MSAAATLDDRDDAGSPRLSYRVPKSGHRIVVTTPCAEPELWEHYLAGAQRSYRAHGADSVLDLDRIGDGRSTSLLFAAVAPDGRIVGGMRAQGPYGDADEAHALAEWDRDPGQPTVRAMIEERLSFGVVESKGLWVPDDVRGRRELVGCLSRGPLHASMILGARFALGTSAGHTLPLWTATGAVVPSGLVPVGYPNERYRTSLMWWDRWALPATVAEKQKRALDTETAQLLVPFLPRTADSA